jgi:glycosyltransferase involved in cell wall biosynthesis
MARLCVALLSSAPPNSVGSMGIYGELVRQALTEYAPQFELTWVNLRDTPLGAGRGLAERLGQLRQFFEARQRAQRAEASVFHVLDGSFAYLVDGIPWERTLVTVHDVIPALQARGRFPVPAPSWIARRAIDMSIDRIRRAGALHAISHNTASDLLALTGRSVDQVLLLPLRRLPDLPDGASIPGRMETPFVLHVGNNGFYKNRSGVLAVFAKLVRERPDLRLVMAGAAPSDTLRELVAGQGLEARVEFVEEPDDEELATLYRRAAVLLFPSLYEGMGWPPVEAMHFGCPVVCSSTASLPETVCDAALLCEPTDVDGLASAVSRLLSDRALASDLVERGFRNLRRFEMRDFALGLSGLYERLGSPKV